LTETPFFFTNEGYRLFGVLHEPTGKARKEGFVFCSPFAEEKLWTHRVFVSFARFLAEKGYPVLRFDYMGNGDSEGNFEECSIETMLSDISCAARTIQDKTPRIESIGILGLRFGATLALLSAGVESGISKLILWEPIIDGSAYMREMLRINLATQTSVYKGIRYNTDALIQMMEEGRTVNVDGYEMSWPMYEQSSIINLINQSITFTGKALLVKISKQPADIVQPFKNLQGHLDNCETASAIEEPFWKEIKRYYPSADDLTRVTWEWLEK
jgi:uncharacterized protein